MLEPELECLSLLKKEEFIDFRIRQKVIDIPVGHLSPDFYLHPLAQEFCKKYPLFGLRFALEHYLNSGAKPENLLALENNIPKLPGPLGAGGALLQNKLAGTYLRPLSTKFILSIYAINDPALNLLMSRYFPIPPPHLFSLDKLPTLIREKNRAEAITLSKMPPSLHFFALQAQRNFRKQRRYREEIVRISYRYRDYLSLNTIDAKTLIDDANTPYQPQCNPELQARILAAAARIKGFTSVKHITAEASLPKILDDALYGRRNLLDFYIEFKPASLYASDVLNGDGNVICLGPQEIDPKANGNIGIEFDLDKLIAMNSSSFFKQLDLEYQTTYRTRQVRLKDMDLYFDQSGPTRISHPDYSYLQFFTNTYRDLSHICYLPKPLLIAYNMHEMHAILCLNFFRFLDRVRNFDDEPAPEFAALIYQKIAELEDEELIEFLLDLERKMSDTAEFNFYGAHRIDLNSINSIWHRETGFKLELKAFIHTLNQGRLEILKAAKIALPSLFLSQRFIEHLITQVRHPRAKEALARLQHPFEEGTDAARACIIA